MWKNIASSAQAETFDRLCEVFFVLSGCERFESCMRFLDNGSRGIWWVNPFCAANTQGYILYLSIFPSLERAHRDGRPRITRQWNNLCWPLWTNAWVGVVLRVCVHYKMSVFLPKDPFALWVPLSKKKKRTWKVFSVRCSPICERALLCLKVPTFRPLVILRVIIFSWIVFR
jgi:hypothetical protein